MSPKITIHFTIFVNVSWYQFKTASIFLKNRVASASIGPFANFPVW